MTDIIGNVRYFTAMVEKLDGMDPKMVRASPETVAKLFDLLAPLGDDRFTVDGNIIRLTGIPVATDSDLPADVLCLDRFNGTTTVIQLVWISGGERP